MSYVPIRSGIPEVLYKRRPQDRDTNTRHWRRKNRWLVCNQDTNYSYNYKRYNTHALSVIHSHIQLKVCNKAIPRYICQVFVCTTKI